MAGLFYTVAFGKCIDVKDVNVIYIGPSNSLRDYLQKGNRVVETARKGYPVDHYHARMQHPM